jgi:hypothetical protein
MSPEPPGDPDAGDALKNIFGFLEKNLPASDGSAEVPAELREKMEQFASGKIPQDEIENLSGQILASPEAIRVFAEILGRLAVLPVALLL